MTLYFFDKGGGVKNHIFFLKVVEGEGIKNIILVDG